MTNTAGRSSSVHHVLRYVALLLFLLIALLLVRDVKGQEILALDQTEISFNQHWVKYMLAKRGCALPKIKPSHAVAVLVPVEACVLPPQLKADEKEKARKLAEEVFGLVDPDASHHK